jgi:hypothetical protein
MNKKLILSGILAVALIFSLAGCGDGAGSNQQSGEVYLTVTGGAVLANASAQTGVYSTGTTMADAYAQTGVVAGLLSSQADASDVVVEGDNLKIKLYLPAGSTTRWYGSGTYDVISLVNGTTVYRAAGVQFSGGAGTCALGSPGATW